MDERCCCNYHHGGIQESLLACGKKYNLWLFFFFKTNVHSGTTTYAAYTSKYNTIIVTMENRMASSSREEQQPQDQEQEQEQQHENQMNHDGEDRGNHVEAGNNEDVERKEEMKNDHEEDESEGEEEPNVFLHGILADLEAFRSKDATTRTMAKNQRCGRGGYILGTAMMCRVSMKPPSLQQTAVPPRSPTTTMTVMTTTTTSSTTMVPSSGMEVDQSLFESFADSETPTESHLGRYMVYISSTQLLLIHETSFEHDFVIGATKILLHALQDEPEASLYLQIDFDGNEADSDGDGAGLELRLTPIADQNHSDGDNNNNNSGNTDTVNLGQVLFDALCKLVSKHPIALEEDDDDGNEDMFGEDMIWAPATRHRPGVAFGDHYGDYYDDVDDDGGASPEERRAMLERLDNILVVRPDLEIPEDGQFEDAYEGDDNFEEGNPLQ